MKALLLNGSGKDDLFTDRVEEVLVEQLESSGATVDTLVLRELDIGWCKGCFHCWIRTPGVCTINDDGREVARRIIRSDLLVLYCPVTFGCYSAHLKKALDRMIPLLLPFFEKIEGNVHHKKRYDRYPKLLGIGVLPCEDAESEQIFGTLVGRNAVNFHSVAGCAVVYRDDCEAGNRKRIAAAIELLGVAEGAKG